jgi:hypothetical protein
MGAIPASQISAGGSCQIIMGNQTAQARKNTRQSRNSRMGAQEFGHFY